MATEMRTDQDFASSPGYQAYKILHIGFAVAPIVMGADKFLHILTDDWTVYLAPIFPSMVGLHHHTFMQAVGVIEILAGVGVFFLPRIFAYVVMAWLWGIIANLLILGTWFDIAMRDFGLSLGALALGRLAEHFHGADETVGRGGMAAGS